MDHRTDRYPVTDSNGATVGFHESATIIVNGREFTSGGAHVDPEHAIGYPHFPNGDGYGARGEMRDWSGNRIGSARVVARWRIHSWVSSHMMQIESTIDGRTYTGRGCGHGMIWKGRAKRG